MYFSGFFGGGGGGMKPNAKEKKQSKCKLELLKSFVMQKRHA